VDAEAILTLNGRPPRDSLVRAVRTGTDLRLADTGSKTPPMLVGHFAVFNRWTEIHSWVEGHFLERIAPGAFKKTFKEQGNRLRVLLEHGQDPEIGNKPIAEPLVVREDEEGAYYEARLFDGLPPLVLDGLRAGQYGASFRFSVVAEDFNRKPGESEHNPDGLPERTIREARVAEFGPVTFGAYDDATAAVRSLTHEFIIGAATNTPNRLQPVLAYLTQRDLRARRDETDETRNDPQPSEHVEQATEPAEHAPETPEPAQPAPDISPVTPDESETADADPDQSPAVETEADPEGHPATDDIPALPEQDEPLYTHSPARSRTTGTALYGLENKDQPWLLT
jgi:HK97 family phage prohead protease